jgi:hypothetical protein
MNMTRLLLAAFAAFVGPPFGAPPAPTKQSQSNDFARAPCASPHLRGTFSGEPS